MQNLPDKGVSGSVYYLLADCTVTGLTHVMLGSQDESGPNGKAFPILGRLELSPNGYFLVSDKAAALGAAGNWILNCWIGSFSPLLRRKLSSPVAFGCRWMWK
jgi:hypothetical protein